LRSSNIRVVDHARVPLRPAKPNIPMTVALGLAFGLISGIVLAIVVEGMDNTVRTPEQVQLISGAASLGLVPLNGGQKSGYASRIAYGSRRALPGKSAAKNGNQVNPKVALISQTSPQSQIAESYRALRTSILLSSLGHPPKVILVTSALPQEGKTTTSINTAIVLAQRGSRVLLVDADLRRPSIHRSFGIRAQAGLSSLLTGFSQEQAISSAPGIPNLSLLPSGPIPPQPSELLACAIMKDYLKKWREEYDHIILDTPPVLSVTDAVALSVDADAVVLVVRSGQTTKQALRHSRELLATVNARLLGVVVNGFDPDSPDAYQYYYYGSKYADHYFEKVEK
jgi:succinoglycan biosynthesis transport protein ExoP